MFMLLRIPWISLMTSQGNKRAPVPKQAPLTDVKMFPICSFISYYDMSWYAWQYQKKKRKMLLVTGFDGYEINRGKPNSFCIWFLGECLDTCVCFFFKFFPVLQPYPTILIDVLCIHKNLKIHRLYKIHCHPLRIHLGSLKKWLFISRAIIC